MKMVHDYEEYAVRIAEPIQCQSFASIKSWSCPQEDVIKINCDTHIGNVTGFGVVSRDHLGNILVAAVHAEAARWTAIVAETTACWIGVQIALRMGYSKVHMECDATNVVQGVKTNVVGLSPFHQFIDAISITSKVTSAFYFTWVIEASDVACSVQQVNSYFQV